MPQSSAKNQVMYPKYAGRLCQPLTVEENSVLDHNLMSMTFADLHALLAYSIEKQAYHQRRFLKDLKPGDVNYHLHEEQYSGWVWWFHITTYVQYSIDRKVDIMCGGVGK